MTPGRPAREMGDAGMGVWFPLVLPGMGWWHALHGGLPVSRACLEPGPWARGGSSRKPTAG